MTNKIKSVSEAYSVNRRTWQIVDKNNKHFRPDKDCVEIKLEKIKFDFVDYFEEDWYYVGYNIKGQKLFQYLADSVNVEFDTEVKND